MSVISFKRLTTPLLFLGAALSGCAELPADAGEGVSDPIIGGATVATDNIGTPLITVTDNGQLWTCTGTMVGPRWLLTARHCVTRDNAITGGTAVAPANVTANLLGGPNSPAGTLIVRHPKVDAALVLLDGVPRTLFGTSFVNRFYKGASTALTSQGFYTQGWGNNAITQCMPRPVMGTGSGTLRSATLTVEKMLDASRFQITPNASGQIEWTGDSGSSLFSIVNGFNRPNGVESTGNCKSVPLTVTAIQHVRGDAIRSWVEGITGNAPGIGRMAGFERADDGTSAVPYRAPDDRIRELCLGGACGGWTLGDLTGTTGAPRAASEISSYIRSDSVSAVVYRSSINHIEELRFSSNGWVATDLSSATGAQAPVGNPAAYTRSDNFSTVVYRDTSNHIRELSLVTVPSKWHVGDLTGDAGAPLAASDPSGYVRTDGVNAVVFRSANDGHIQELSLDFPIVNGWGWGDLTAITGAHAATGTPRPYTRTDGWSIVTFRGTDNHIYELGLSPGSQSWQVGDLTAITGAVAAASDPAPYVRFDRWNIVVFRGTDSHIYELGLAPGSDTWQVGDLTAITGSPLATGTPSGYARPDGVSVVNFQTSDNHIHELSLDGGGWHTADLSAIAGGP